MPPRQSAHHAAGAPTFDVLSDELNVMRQVYIASTLPKLGSANPWVDPFFTVWETCQEFEQAHMRILGEADGLYTGEDEYPDSFGHGRWLAEQKIDRPAQGYDVARALNAFAKAGL